MSMSKTLRHNSLANAITGATCLVFQQPWTMDLQEDAFNKLQEQSISYNGLFTLADGEDAAEKEEEKENK